MHRNNLFPLQRGVLTLGFMMLAFVFSAWAQTESVLYTFTGGTDGSGPTGNLIFDSAGNLYGTTDAGGIVNGRGGDGVVFELSPVSGGGWTEKALYAFQGGTDGDTPDGGVVFDAAGNLYGSTNYGGAHGQGTVYELSPASGGGWTEKVLYSFAGGTGDVANPQGSLIFDAAGNLYGTSTVAGAHNQGGVFQLAPASGGTWTESVIYNGTLTKGGRPGGSVATDGNGNFYVTAAIGGASNAGTVLRLRFNGTSWNAMVIHTFVNGADGSEPLAGVTFQAPARLYGTTQTGGGFGSGTAFVLTAASANTWNERIIHNFGAAGDGLFPATPVTLNGPAIVFGTAGSGGTSDGVAYELALSGGVWHETILHDFSTGSDAGGPEGGVVLDSAGNLFGTGHNGGSSGAGAVYEITP